MALPVKVHNNTFKRDTLFYGSAIITDRLIGFCILPLLTRGLSLIDFGVWSQIQTIYGFLSTALLLGFYHTVSGLVANRNETEIKSIFKGILTIVLATSSVFAIVCLLFPQTVSIALFADIHFSGLIFSIVCFSISEAMFELVVLAYLRARHSVPQCALFLIVKSIFRLLAVWLGVHEHNSLVVILGVISVVNLGLVIYALKRYIFKRGSRQPNALDIPFWRSAMRRSVGIALAVFMAWGCLAANRFMIVHFLGLHAVAVYSANYSLLSVTTFVPMILTFTLLHHLSGLAAQKNVNEAGLLFNQAINYYLYITLPLLVLIVIFYQLLIGLVAPGYEVTWSLRYSFVLYFFLFGLEQLFIFSIFAQENSKAFLIRMLAFLLSLIAGCLLIPKYGIEFSVWPLCMVSIMIIFWCSSELKESIIQCFDWKAYMQLGVSTALMAIVGAVAIKIIPVRNSYTMVIVVVGMVITYWVAEMLRSNSITRSILNTMLHWKRSDVG